MPALLATLDSGQGGHSADPLLERARRATVLFHPATRSTYANGSVGLLRHDYAHRPRALWLKDGIRVVIDGGFHNGASLRRRLGLSADTPDEAIVHEIYRTQSLATLAELEGAWAWILWDAASRTLWAARDVLGRRALFYGERQGWLVCGTQLHAVTEALGISLNDLSASYVAAFLTVGKARPGETPYDGVHAVPAGHLLDVRGGARIRRIQTIEPTTAPIPKDPQECGREFQRLLGESLRPIITGSESVWFDLSGGLDSSSLVCLMAQLVSQNGANTSRFRTLSLVDRGEDGRHARTAIRDVTRASGFTNTELDTDVLHPFQELGGGGLAWDYPTLELLTWRTHREIVDLISATGPSAYLKGLGAEAVLLGEQIPPIHLADLLRRGQLIAWAQGVGEWRRAMHFPVLPFLWMYSLQPLVARRHFRVGSPTSVPAWMSHELVTSTAADEWRCAMWSDIRFSSRATQWEHEHFARIPESLHKGPLHRTCNVELPFLTERVIRWCMAVPWSVRITPTQNKRLLRLGMAGILPEAIRLGTRVTTGNGSMTRGLQAEWNAVRTLMTNSLVARAGWVNEDRLLEELRRARQGCCAFLPGALRSVALEVWLRSRSDAGMGESR